MVENFKLQFDESAILESSENLAISNINDLSAAETNSQPTPIPLDSLLSSPAIEAPVNALEMNAPTDESNPLSQVSNVEANNVIEAEPEKVDLQETNTSNQTQDLEQSVVSESVSSTVENVIVDYRSKYFELEEKNKELQNQIDELNKKIEDIKKVLE